MYRRNLIGALTGVTAASLSGCSSLSPAGTAGAEAGLSVDDAGLEVTSPNGVLDEVWIVAEVDFEYSGWYENYITKFGYNSKIDGETILDDDYDIYNPDWIWDEEADEDSGSATYRVFQHRISERDRIFLFDDAPNYEQADLEVDEPGETKTFELELYIEMRLVADQDGVVWTGSDTATLTITHTHQADDDDGDGDSGDDEIVKEDGDASMGIGDISLFAEVDGELVS